MDINEIIDFNSCDIARKLRYYYESISILESMKVERNETRHSRFIRWLFLDKDINLISPDSPINHFIDLLFRRGCLQGHFKNDEGVDIISATEMKDIILRNHIIRIDDVVREHQTKGADGKTILKLCDDNKTASGLSDLVLKTTVFKNGKKSNAYPLTICIENKIAMEEQDHQTWKYYTYFTGDEDSLPEKLSVIPQADNRFDENGKQLDPFYPKRKDEKFLFVYLKAMPIFETDKLEKTQCECCHYIQICYQDIMNYVISPILQRPDISLDKKANIQQYVKSLSVPALSIGDNEEENYDDKDQKKHNDVQYKQLGFAMAIDSPLQNEIDNFFQKHPFFIENTIIGAYEGNEDCKKILSYYKSFFEAILNSIVVSTQKEEEYENSRELLNAMFYLDGKKSSIIKVNGRIRCLLNRADIAVEFARTYVNANPEKSIADYNLDFKCIKTDLFSSIEEKRNDTNSPKNQEIGKLSNSSSSIFFIKNIWADIYLKKLIKNIPDIIKKGHYFEFKVFNQK